MKAEMKEANKALPEEPSLESCAAVIESLPVLLERVCKQYAVATGWSIAIYAAGPEPILDGRIGGVTAYAGWKDRGKNTFWPQMDVKEHSKKFVDWVGTLYSAEEIKGRVLQPAELAALQEPPDELPLEEEKESNAEEEGGGDDDEDEDDGDDDEDDEDLPPICPPSPTSPVPPPLPASTPPTATPQSAAPAQRDVETPKALHQMTAKELLVVIESLKSPTLPVQTAQLDNLYEIPPSFENGGFSASGPLTSSIHNTNWFDPGMDYQFLISGDTLSTGSGGSQVGLASSPAAQHHYGVSMDPYVGLLPNDGGYTHLNNLDRSGGMSTFNSGGFSDILPPSLSMSTTGMVMASNTPSPTLSPPAPTMIMFMGSHTSSSPTATAGAPTPAPTSSSTTATTAPTSTSPTATTSAPTPATPAPTLSSPTTMTSTPTSATSAATLPSPTTTTGTATTSSTPATSTAATEVEGPQRRKRKPAKSKEVVPLTTQNNAKDVTHDLGEVRKNYTGVAAEVTRELETSTVLVSLT
ncbi:hypothetical protein BDN72DRAFT_905334 [Pluteus cervinus]|uniref:Uncharacterized protein n=1 Tax=Pluteus cervinus TaxID=181527 RepID=A0ACD3A5B0_9AGAR|nr:hypothetical protein BDN72DRAFT_905334 [Pluteus cervinus]